jgi:formate-dependent nitrite reductase membrane component NrfD
MAFLEKGNWVVLLVAVVTLVTYGGTIAGQAVSKPVAEIGWVQPMIYSIVGFIVANILGMIIVAASNPREADKKDQRDKEIDRFGERVGNYLIIAGSCVALVLAMAAADRFWIGNAIYFAGILGAMGASVTKIAAYHGPFQKW